MSRAGSRSLQRLFPFSLLDPLSHPGSVHSGIDDEMSDMDILGSEFSRHALGDGAQAELRTSEGCVSDAAT